MPASTDVFVESRERELTYKAETEVAVPQVNRSLKTVITDDSGRSSSDVDAQNEQPPFDPSVLQHLYHVDVSPVADSTPLQIWEGTVLQVDDGSRAMHVILDAKMQQVPRHTADIDLEWVSEQDKDLVRPGAVFYLTLFKRTKRGSIENAQELRFRRRPAWSPTQLKHIEEDASELIAKMRDLPSEK